MSEQIIIEQDMDDFNDDFVEEMVVAHDDDAVIDETDRSTTGEASLPKGASRNKDGTITLKLLKEVELQIRDQTGKVRVEVYDALTFHHLTGADLRAIQAAREGEQNIVAFARATKLSLAVMNKLFDKMHVADINASGEVMASFLATPR